MFVVRNIIQMMLWTFSKSIFFWLSLGQTWNFAKNERKNYF